MNVIKALSDAATEISIKTGIPKWFCSIIMLIFLPAIIVASIIDVIKGKK